jgi:hypothetical protein
VALHEMTTRKHYPGKHVVDLLLNGSVQPLGEFQLVKSQASSARTPVNKRRIS